VRSRNATVPEFSAAYPAHLVASWPLGVSHSITVRPIRPEDIDLETEFARRLSKETRYNRFLGGGVGLTPEMLEKFTRIDFSRDMALIATATIEGAETAIGVTRYARLADDVTGEFAITVADAAALPGIATNTAMLRLARSQGFRIEQHPEGAELRRVVLELS
jgi:acetyltransferase